MKCVLIGSLAEWLSGQRVEPSEVKRCEGFTLLEALIALVILVVALQALYQSFSSDLRASRIASQHEQARILAQSLLAEYASERIDKAGSCTGKFDKFSWRLSVNPAPEIHQAQTPNNRWLLYSVSVKVLWPPHRQLKLATFKLGGSND